mmetsp:Transcript_11807/g.15424  ORF Transcript_11807/g.15424 Transcript_11807/m.15424 type:complete len:401 (-) Transcript_11807:258-1460(-)
MQSITTTSSIACCLVLIFCFQVFHVEAFSPSNTFSTHHSSSKLAIPRHATLTTASTGEYAAGSQDLDWENLGFAFRPTRSHIKFVYKDGEWGEGELVGDPYIKTHIAATALHYGQAVFEGLKAMTHPDGSVKIFRADENAKRINRSGGRILMPAFPEDRFVEACKTVVRDNLDFVPPYGTGGSLYIRPLLYGSGPRIGLQPADEYTLLIMVMPVGDYYKGGISPVTAVVIDDYDRAAPRGVGECKVAGNYAADMLPNIMAKKAGYPIGLYLDAKTNQNVEEFSTSNFIGITKDGVYRTPDSPTILKSITNKSLMTLAEDEGLKIDRTPIPIGEVKDFAEVAACGTAVVLTPINKVVYKDQVMEINGGSPEIGPFSQKLYNKMRAIQYGEEEDKYGWTFPV